MSLMPKLISTEDRRRLAAAAGINEQYLYQCLSGRRDMGAEEAVRVEAAVDFELRRWDLCQSNWHRIWPELVGSPDAPPVSQEA